MPNNNTPRGFRPVGMMGGAPYSGSVTEYRIASGYAANMFSGDCVKLLSTGYVNVSGAGVPFLGVLVGVRWIATDGTPKVDNKWISGTVTQNAADAVAIVVDDPNVIFEGRFTNSASNPAVSDIGGGFDLYDSGGSTVTGISGQGIDYSSVGAASLKQFRMLEFVKKPDNDIASATSAYCLARFVPMNHQARVQTGI